MSFMSKTKGLGLLLIGAAGGAAVQYFLDPIQGRTRRARTADQAGAAARDVVREAERQAAYRAGQAQGAVVEATKFGEKAAPDDKTLKHRVETRVLGREDMPKGDVVVHAENGIVQLRGEVDDPELIHWLVRHTRDVEGVADVLNYLHPPGQPAPTTEEAVEASRQALAESGRGSAIR
jgi:osmotically-inducible protein OsmY